MSMVLSNYEAKKLLVDYINAGSVVDPLATATRGTDDFAFTELRKGSGKFPKVFIQSIDQEPNTYYFGDPKPYDTDIIFNIWFYTAQSNQDQFYSTAGSVRNEAFVEQWLTGTLIDALRQGNTLPFGLNSPHFGSFSGVEKDPDRPSLLRGFLPVSFARRECS